MVFLLFLWLQVFGQEAREAAGFRELAAKGLRVANSYAMYQGLVEGAGRLAVNVGTIALLGLGGERPGTCRAMCSVALWLKPSLQAPW